MTGDLSEDTRRGTMDILSDTARRLTYRSRGRSLIEVVLVRTIFSIVMGRIHSSRMMIIPTMVSPIPFLLFDCFFIRRFVLLCFWWGLLVCCASETTFGRNGHRNDSGNDGWPRWPRPTIKWQDSTGCMGTMVQAMHLPMKRRHPYQEMAEYRHEAGRCRTIHFISTLSSFRPWHNISVWDV